MKLLPFLSGFGVDMVFSFVAAGSMLAGFERLNREVQVLLHSVNLRPTGKKKKKGKVVCSINSPVEMRVRWDLNPGLSAVFTPSRVIEG